MAGTDSIGLVSSFGKNSQGNERSMTGWGTVGVCPIQATKDTTASCP